jgi:hypothetical protein
MGADTAEAWAGEEKKGGVVQPAPGRDKGSVIGLRERSRVSGLTKNHTK